MFETAQSVSRLILPQFSTIQGCSVWRSIGAASPWILLTIVGSVTSLLLTAHGPSGFAIWREVDSETAANIARILEELFRERGAVTELLMDNGAGFRSHQVAEVCRRWNVRRHFRGAYRSAGNDIVERHQFRYICNPTKFGHNLQLVEPLHDITSRERLHNITDSHCARRGGCNHDDSA